MARDCLLATLWLEALASIRNCVTYCMCVSGEATCLIFIVARLTRKQSELTSV